MWLLLLLKVVDADVVVTSFVHVDVVFFVVVVVVLLVLVSWWWCCYPVWFDMFAHVVVVVTMLLIVFSVFYCCGVVGVCSYGWCCCCLIVVGVCANCFVAIFWVICSKKKRKRKHE